MELPSNAKVRDAIQAYSSSLGESSDAQLILASVANGVVTALFSAIILGFIVLKLVEKTTGKMGEHDGAIISAFVFFVMAGTGFVSGFSGTLAIARRKLSVGIIASFTTLLVTAASWLATAQLAQVLLLATPMAMVALVTVVLLPRRA